jgi:pimeloyl-ACP methyl ester carboxylesterase
MGLGATHVWWHRLTPILSSRFRTILFDNRGVGESDVPPGPYDMAAMADDAMAVLDAAKIETAHVFGASMGGMIAQEVVLRHPQRVRSLILGCTACGGRDVVPAARENPRDAEHAGHHDARGVDATDGAVHLRRGDAP